MANTRSPSLRSSRPWSRGTAHAAAYRLHVLVGLVLSLTAVTAAFRVPWSGGPPSVGWGAHQVEAFSVTFEETEPQRSEQAKGLVSQYRIESLTGDAPARIEEEQAATETTPPTALPDEPAPLPALEKLTPILEFAEEAPQLTGGLGSLYLHIRYPQAAIDLGIEGQLILKFVVEPDGRTSEIVVEKPLHPLCDSAAVRALREVAFVPGRQNGEAARVRMRLPVRFRLVGPSAAPLPDSSLATAG